MTSMQRSKASRNRSGKYEERRDELGNRTVLPDDIKMAVLEGMVPEHIEEYLQLNRARLVSYQAMREEVGLFLETPTENALKNRSAQQYDGAVPMDIGSLAPKGKGKGGKKGRGVGGGLGQGQGAKGGKGKESSKNSSSSWSKGSFQGYCDNCGKGGHKKAECWTAGGGQANPSQQSKSSKEKGKNKGKSKGTLAALETNQEVRATTSTTPTPILQAHANKENPVNEVSTFELCSFYSAEEGATCKSRRAIKCNLDTGAAVTAFPLGFKQYASELFSPNGAVYRTASGEMVQDGGGARLVTKSTMGSKCSLKWAVGSCSQTFGFGG